MDGYFPSDFRKDHPEGVLFHLTDRHRDAYNGTEQRSLVDGSLEGSTAAQAYSRDEILKKIPSQKVLPNGDVVDIRGGIASRLTKDKSDDGPEYSYIRKSGGSAQNTDEIVSRLSASKVEDSFRNDEDEDSDASSECDKNDRPPSYQLSGLLQSTKRIAAMSQQLTNDDGANIKSPATKSASALNNSNNRNINSNSTNNAISAVAGSGAIVIISTPASQSTSPSSVRKKTEGTALIRIKWLDGRMLHMKLWDSDLVGDVREHIRRYLYNMNTDNGNGGNSSGANIEDDDNFELRGTYPPRPLPDAMSLAEAGLVPNGTVHAKRHG